MSSCAGDLQALERLKAAVAEGKHWYLALLEAIRGWTSSEENYHGRHYRYLIDSEAFDWLVLAERLCEELDGLIPEDEQIALLFFDQPPVELATDEFKELIGNAKYQAYLTYLYGVLVEEFLILAVTEELRKRRHALGLTKDEEVTDEVYRRIYGVTQQELLALFWKEKRYPGRKSMSVGEVKEFTYWLFKQRVRSCDKSCVASDTKKALVKMRYYMRLKSCRFSHSS